MLESVKLAIAMAIALTFCTPCSSGFADGFVEIETEESDHTAQVACTFDKLLAKMDPKTGAVTEENPDFLKKGDAAMVLIKPTKPLAIEEQGKFKPLARFAIRDMGATVAAGMCLKIEEHWD